MAINITTAFPGEFLDKILTKATIGNELVESNLIHVEMNVLKRLYFGKLLATDMLQHRVEMPTADTAKGNFNYTENYVEPKDVMVYTRYNPRTLESIWRKWQPTGPMVNETWGPKAQADFLSVFADKVAEEVGYQMINGIYSESTDGLYFDGIVTRILASGRVKAAGAGEPTYAKKFKAMLSKFDKAARKKKNLKFVTSIDDCDNYDEELKLNTYKNGDLTIQQKLAYNGIPVVGLAQWPKGLIVLTLADSSLESNFYAGCAWQTDETFIKEGLVQEDGEQHFIKMLMKFDTQIALPEYVVVCDEREATATTVTENVIAVGNYVNSLEQGTLAANATYTFATSGAGLLKGASVYVKNATTGSYKITIAYLNDSGTSTNKVLAKGEAATFYYDGTNWRLKA